MNLVYVPLVFSLFSAVAGARLKVLSRQTLNDETKYMSSAGLLVLFDKDGKENESELQEMILRSRRDFDLFIINSMMFDCKSEPEDKLCQFSGRQNLMIWVNWKASPTYLPMGLMDSQVSLLTHCLMALTGRNSKALKSQSELKDLLQAAEEEQHVTILGYFERFGTPEHKAFMAVCYTLVPLVHVGYTNRTDLDFLNSLSNEGVSARVVVVGTQSEEEDPEEPFVFTYTDVISEVELNKYLRVFTLPLTHKLLSLEVDDPYSLYGLHIACVLMLPDQFQKHQQMIEHLARRFRDSFGFVLVNMKKFGKKYNSFGLDEPKKYPVLSVKIHGDLDRFEFIEQPEDFTENFLVAFLNSTRNVYQEAKTSKDVLTLTTENYRDIVYLSGLDVIVCFCHDYFETCNLQFHATWRRLGRGVRVAGYSDKLVVAFVSASDPKEAPEDDITDFPDIRFKYGNAEEFIGYQHKGKTPQHKLKPLLRFLAELGYTDIPVMKKRDSDEIPIIIPKDIKTVDSPPQLESESTTSENSEIQEELEHSSNLEQSEREMEEMMKELEAEEARVTGKKSSTSKDEEEMTGAVAPLDGEEESDGSDDEEEAEQEDDEVAGSVFYLTYKKKADWRDKTTALTDKTIDVKRSECAVLVVHFLSPWSAKSKAFVPFYAEAAKNFSSHSTLVSTVCFAHVDCTAYPEVCDRFTAFIYPTITIFRGDEQYVYKGPLDAGSLVQTVELFQFDPVIELPTDTDVETLVNVDYPPFVIPHELSVIGLFKSKDAKAYEEYEAVAADGRGTLPFTVCLGEVAKIWAKNFNVELPAVVAVRRGKYLLPESELFQQTARTAFDRGNITRFVSKSRLSVAQLTPLNFPQFYSSGLPLAITFVYGEDFQYENDLPDSEIRPQERVFSKAISDAARDSKFNSKLLFCWMDVNEYGNVLGFYSKAGTVPTIVIVDHKLGDVYMMMDKGLLAPSDVLKWLKQYLDGELKPTRRLRHKEWKPARPPIDFLAKEDEREAAKAQGRAIDRSGGSRFREAPKVQTGKEDVIYGKTGFDSEHLHDEL